MTIADDIKYIGVDDLDIDIFEDGLVNTVGEIYAKIRK